MYLTPQSSLDQRTLGRVYRTESHHVLLTLNEIRKKGGWFPNKIWDKSLISSFPHGWNYILKCAQRKHNGLHCKVFYYVYHVPMSDLVDSYLLCMAYSCLRYYQMQIASIVHFDPHWSWKRIFWGLELAGQCCQILSSLAGKLWEQNLPKTFSRNSPLSYSVVKDKNLGHLSSVTGRLHGQHELQSPSLTVYEIEGRKESVD